MQTKSAGASPAIFRALMNSFYVGPAHHNVAPEQRTRIASDASGILAMRIKIVGEQPE